MLSLKLVNLKLLKTTKRVTMDRENNNMTYSDKLKNDEKILRIAMLNAYKLIIGKITYEDLLDKEDQFQGY